MRAEPLFIVGAGRVGCALALGLRRAGVPLAGLWTRSAEGAARASALLDMPCAWGAFPPQMDLAQILVISVADQFVNDTAGALLDGGLLRKARQIFHCGGGRSAQSALSNLRNCPPAESGAFELGTLHPLLAISDPLTSSHDLSGAFFGLEGDPGAMAVARELLARLGARSLELSAEQMALYHCAAVMASNQAVALWGAARNVLCATGVAPQEAVAALTPLIRSTVENLSREGIIQSLTGPVRRGDARIIEDHLAALAERSPGQLDLYRAATRATVEMTRGVKDPPQEALLEQILAALATIK